MKFKLRKFIITYLEINSIDFNQHRRLVASATTSEVTGLNFGTTNNQILKTSSTTVIVTAKDSSGSLIGIGGENFSVNGLPMTDNSDGTYSYPITFNNIGKVNFIFVSNLSETLTFNVEMQSQGKVDRKNYDNSAWTSNEWPWIVDNIIIKSN